MNIVRIYELFPTESDCIAHLEKVRWNGKPICPYCRSDRTTPARPNSATIATTARLHLA